MKYFDDMKDNGENVDNYAGYDDVVDNQDPNDLVRIAHEVNDCVEGSFINEPENPDVGSTDFRDRVYNTLTEDYDYLDEDERDEIYRIIMEEY